MSVWTETPDATQVDLLNDYTKRIQKSYSLSGDASGGTSWIQVLPYEPYLYAVCNRHALFINYINYITTDLNFTNALGNRMDYPYVDINGWYWKNYPGCSQDRIPLYMEEGVNQLSVAVQFRVQNIDLGRPQHMTPSVKPAILIHYFNTNLTTYKLVINYTITDETHPLSRNKA